MRTSERNSAAPFRFAPLSIASAGALLPSACGGATTVDSDARGEPEALESPAVGDTDDTAASEDPIARWRASAEEAATDGEDYGAASRLCATMLPDDVVARLVEFPGGPIDTTRARSAGDSVTCTFAHGYTDDRNQRRASITVEHDTAPRFDLYTDDDFGPDLAVALRESHSDWISDAKKVLDLLGDRALEGWSAQCLSLLGTERRATPNPRRSKFVTETE